MTRDFARNLAMSRRFLTVEDVETIQMVVRMLSQHTATMGRPLRVVDLGAGSGTTALAVLDERDDSQITTVDNDRANIDWAELAVRMAYPEADWLGVVEDAADTGHYVGELVDLLLHDASHEREHVERDLRAWLPRLAPHAMVWCHDWAAPPPSWGQPASPGVREAVEALLSDGSLKRFGTGGLGWIGVVGVAG